MDKFEFDEAVMLGDSSLKLSDENVAFFQNLGISVVSGDEQKAQAEAWLDNQ